jgi:hypothetical protein
MKLARFSVFLLLIVAWYGSGCANIVPPTGGKKDVKAPKLLSVIPGDSLLNTRVTKLELRFDEFLDPSAPASEITVSPLLPFPVTTTVSGRKITIKIPDSLLFDNTTYRISFGHAIKDLHEGNVFQNYHYVFSTGGYFDSLQLAGTVTDAITGVPDTGALVMLYSAAKTDSIVVKEKPLYVAKVSREGKFAFDGLPGNRFRIYALRDQNNNMIYDGGKEAIAFTGQLVMPVDSVTVSVALSLFVEESNDTLPEEQNERSLGKRSSKADDKADFNYSVGVDTTNVNNRTFDVNRPLIINFTKPADSINAQRIFLSVDSVGAQVEVPFVIWKDTQKINNFYMLKPVWKEDAVYTLRLLKGFAKDSTGAEAMPSKHIFRTKNDDDYAKLHVHMPAKYAGDSFLLLVTIESDTVHYKPVTDTLVHLSKLRLGNYNLKVIKDANKNGKWDTGDLFSKRQPEVVIPNPTAIQLKAGWDNTVDFEKKEDKKPAVGSSPLKRDRAPSK